MSKTLLTNISSGPLRVPFYGKTLNPGVGMIVNDVQATVITNLGGASAIAGLFGTADVPDGNPFDAAATGDAAAATDYLAPQGQAAAGTSTKRCSPDHVHPFGTVADAQTGVGALLVYTRQIADAATADYDVVITEKVEIIDVIVQKRSTAAGSNANTVQVKNAGNAISNAISINGAADQAIVRAGSIDDSQSTIDAGGTLRVTVTKAGGDAAVGVQIIAVRRA